MQQQSVEINSVKWVLKELQPMLKDVQRALESCAEQGGDFSGLQASVDVLRQVHGTLQMVELHGAAQLAEEMRHVAAALIQSQVDDGERALETLLRTALQLPDYLERLQAGSRDVPLVLLPLLNELRDVRSAEPVTERDLFFPDLSVALAMDTRPAGSLKIVARTQRRRFQRHLLDWFKSGSGESLRNLDAVFGVLEHAAVEIPSRRVWYIARALVEATLDGHLGKDVLKPFLGQLDRLVRVLVNDGQRKFESQVSLDLLKGMLFQVARSNGDGKRVNEVRATYQLAKLLPNDEQIALAKQTLAGPNLELLAVVNASIKEDISQIKDAIEIYVHSDTKDRERLRPLQELFGRVADTVHMLGIEKAQQLLAAQAGEVAGIIDGEQDVADERLMALAGVLLNVEETLDEFVSLRADLMGSVPAAPRQEEALAIAALPGPEFQALLSAVIREALGDLARVREGMLAFLANPERVDHIQSVPRLLDEVNGAMFMLPLDKVVPLLRGLSAYLRVSVAADRRYPQEQEQDLLADVVAAIEYYLEAVEQGRGDMTHILTRGENALRALKESRNNPPPGARLNVVGKSDSRARPAGAPAPSARASPERRKDTGDAAAVAEPASGARAETARGGADTARAAAAADTGRSADTAPAQVLAGDVDDEILEVFLEEAVGELQEISSHLPQWQADPGNETSLVRIRRAFHTLKGSGRVIGAELIGEYSWSMENLLNQVIAGRVAELDAVFELLDEAVGVLPQLIEQLRGTPEPVAEVAELIARGHALANPLAEAEAEAEAPPAPANDAEVAAVPEGAAAEAQPPAAPQAEPAAGTEDADAPGDDAQEYFEVDDLDDVENEEVTLQSLNGEENVLDNFEVDEYDSSEEDEDVTLASKTGEVEVLDNFEVDEYDGSEDDEDVTLASKTGEVEVLDNFEVDEYEDDGSDDEVTLESHEAEPDSTAEVAAEELLGGAPSAPVTAPAADEPVAPAVGSQTLEQPVIDPVLLEIFAREAEGHIATLRKLVEKAHALGGALTPRDELIRGLHTLHGSAQTAEVEDIALLSGTLEKIAKAKHELGGAFDAEETALLRDCLDGMDQALKWFTERGEKPKNLRALESQLRVLERKIEGQADTVEQDDELIGIFIEEGDELLENADRLLNQWRQRPNDQVLISDLQRQLHTLKGGARMANFTPIADLSHALESLVVVVTDRGGAPTGPTFELLHEAIDALTVMLEQARGRQPVSRVQWLLDELAGLRESEQPPSAVPAAQSASAPALPDTPAPAPAPQAPVQPAPVAEEPAAPAPGAQEQVRVNADLLDNLVNYAGEVNIYQSRLGQQVSDYRFNLDELDQTVFRLRDQLRKMDMETEAQILYRYEKEEGAPEKEFDPLELDRYSHIQELSRALMESVADLESIKSILGDITRDSESLLQQQTRLSADLQDGLMRTRMVRFDRLSARLARVVRQTASTLGKKTDLEVRGGATEIDRTVQERIVAPLEHMLRNSVSHGIELPAVREKLGKPPAGRITIELQRDGTDVMIRVEDDGAGIDLEAVRTKAIARGLLPRDAHAADEDIVQLILETGMSTAKEVTQISGRGVGMDVVASEIKQLGGSVGISTRTGQGARFSVRLPLTLAVNQALLVDVAGETYALPLTGIVGVSQVDGAELQRYYVDRSRKYQYAGFDYDVHHLGALLDIGSPRLGEHDQIWPLIMLRSGEHRVAMHVEALVGRREVVVKPVGPQISTLRGISGATILPDGRVVLILDAASLLRALSTVQAVEEEAIAPEEARAGVTVMVVDDSITIRKVTQRMLERHDINVIAAKDGVDAVTLLADHIPDLMLLDIEMPRMDGYEVAAYVRNNERLHDVPIIMITSRTGDKHRRRAEEIGVNRYLGKPYQESELLEHINEILAVQA